MKIIRPAAAGTLESSDALVTVAPSSEGVDITIQSIVYKQFGQAIRDTVAATLAAFDVTHARVAVNDRGALDCVIQARVEAALLRAAKEDA